MSAIRTILQEYFNSKNNVDTLIKTHRVIIKFFGNSFYLQILKGNKEELLIEKLILNEDSVAVAIKLARRILEN